MKEAIPFTYFDDTSKTHRPAALASSYHEIDDFTMVKPCFIDLDSNQQPTGVVEDECMYLD